MHHVTAGRGSPLAQHLSLLVLQGVLVWSLQHSRIFSTVRLGDILFYVAFPDSRVWSSKKSHTNWISSGCLPVSSCAQMYISTWLFGFGQAPVIFHSRRKLPTVTIKLHFFVVGILQCGKECHSPHSRRQPVKPRKEMLQIVLRVCLANSVVVLFWKQ